MSRFRCYITPFLESAEYGTEVEITDYIVMDSFSSISQQVDNNEYDVGVLTFNDLDLKLRNESGRFSSADITESIFRYKRSNALFRMAWEIEDEGTVCGTATCGRNHLSETQTIYEGFINDESASTDIKTQETSLKVLSMESIITRIEVPFVSMSNGMLVSAAIYALLNQSLITDLITISASNITLAIDKTIDDITELESMTGKEALDEFLFLSNSILFIKDRVAYVTDRVESAALEYTFYGPMSTDGLENIQNISKLKSGMSKMFNFWTWQDQTFNVSDPESVAKYGVRKKEITSALITNTTKQQEILQNYSDEFAFPEESFVLTTPITYETLGLFFLDKISVDYPTVYIASEGRDLPTYGVSKYGQAYYPIRESVLTIDFERRFKIMGVDINVSNQLIELSLRET